MFGKKKGKKNKFNKSGWDLLGITSKKLKVTVVILGFLFTIFLITAFMNTLQSYPSMIWWGLSLVCGLTLSAIVIFKR